MRERRSRPFQRAKTKGQQSGLLVGICVKCFFFVVSAVLILCLGYLYTHHALITASSRQQLDSKPDLGTPGQKILETRAGMSYYINPQSPLFNDPPNSGNSLRVRDVEQKQQHGQKKRRVAYAITITKDGFFQDGAAVLAYSIYNNSRHVDFDISLLAFVHPNVSSSRPLLTQMGFQVIVAPTPINTSAIRYEFLRTKIDKNGCCGASELIKINSYRLIEYDYVVHLDADTYLLNPIDELFEFPNRYSLQYTTDPNMASHKGKNKMPVQGGFIVLKPSIEDYNNLIWILMNTEFVQGGAWNRSKIGWFWGGMTVQGVLPYYYNEGGSGLTALGRTKVLDRCYYNTMADVPECITQELYELKSAHFTICQKPWNCEKHYANNLCKKLHQQWFENRKKAEEFYGVSVNPNPCPTGGRKWYKPMDFQGAKFPYSVAVKFQKNEKTSFMPPLPGSGFNEGIYW